MPRLAWLASCKRNEIPNYAVLILSTGRGRHFEIKISKTWKGKEGIRGSKREATAKGTKTYCMETYSNISAKLLINRLAFIALRLDEYVFFFKQEFPPYVWRPRNENLRWWSNLSSTLIQNGWYTKNEKKGAFAAQRNWLRNYEYCEEKVLIKELFCVNLLNPLCHS